MNLKKIQVIVKYLTLTTSRKILAFQNLAEYYQRFITEFLEITALIIDLLKKDKFFK